MAEIFGDLEDLFGACRFSDCAHGREPGSAVQAALADGSLDDRRWTSYLKLQREVAALGRRHDAAASRAYQREWQQKLAAAGKSQRPAEPLTGRSDKSNAGSLRAHSAGWNGRGVTPRCMAHIQKAVCYEATCGLLRIETAAAAALTFSPSLATLGSTRFAAKNQHAYDQLAGRSVVAANS